MTNARRQPWSLSTSWRPLGQRKETDEISTQFSGLYASSTKKDDEPVGATVRFQREYNGKQPGDAIKAVAVFLHIASLSEVPLRLLLGSDAYNAAEKHIMQTFAAEREWKNLERLDRLVLLAG